MNQNIILIFILLATLSVVNALPHQLDKRGTQWGGCTIEGKQIPLVNVKMSSDPPVQGLQDTFTVSGNFEINKGDVLVVKFFSDSSELVAFATYICGVQGLPDCPVNPFSINFPVALPTDLPDPYFVYVIVGNPVTENIYGCATAQFGGRPEDSYPIDSYPIASYPIASYPIASHPIASGPIASYSFAELM